MSQNSKNKKAGRDLKAEAAKLVKALDIRGETRAETQRLLSGVQRALEHHLRQHNTKARELDKKAKKLKQLDAASEQSETEVEPSSADPRGGALVPWTLLGLSWLLFIGYWVYEHFRPALAS